MRVNGRAAELDCAAALQGKGIFQTAAVVQHRDETTAARRWAQGARRSKPTPRLTFAHTLPFHPSTLPRLGPSLITVLSCTLTNLRNTLPSAQKLLSHHSGSQAKCHHISTHTYEARAQQHPLEHTAAKQSSKPTPAPAYPSPAALSACEQNLKNEGVFNGQRTWWITRAWAKRVARCAVSTTNLTNLATPTPTRAIQVLRVIAIAMMSLI